MHIRDKTRQKLIMQFSMKQCKIPLSFYGRGCDKMQNSDFRPTHQTGGAKHSINDFCFLKSFKTCLN